MKKMQEEMFKRESDILIKLNNKYIMKVYDYRKSSSNYYMLMELCKGKDLEEYMKNNKYITNEQKEKFTYQLSKYIFNFKLLV
jgi:serine/threonine protein kinase